jgi:phosphonatase-like hydrolase
MTTAEDTCPIRLVCLDMAGTTIDDGSAVIESFAVAVDQMGLTGPDRERALAHAVETMGQSKIEVFRALLRDDDLARSANAMFERAYAEVVEAGGVAPMTGAVELFEWCHGNDISVCLTTGFAPPTRDAIVRRLGWTDLVDLVLSPADAGRGRPSPDMILTASSRSTPSRSREGMGAELEKRFAARAGEVDGMPGFEEFMLLRPVAGDSRYFVVTRWETEEAFQAWRTSREFQQQHANTHEDGGPVRPSPSTRSPPAPRCSSSRSCRSPRARSLRTPWH